MSAMSKPLGLTEISCSKRNTEKRNEARKDLWGVRHLGFRETKSNMLGRCRRGGQGDGGRPRLGRRPRVEKMMC